MDIIDWRQECIRLQIELDAVRVEMEDFKDRWERLLLWKDQPRLHVRGLTTLDCVGTDKGKASTQTYTTVGWVEGDDFK